jgi:hypothetical protein
MRRWIVKYSIEFLGKCEIFSSLHVIVTSAKQKQFEHESMYIVYTPLVSIMRTTSPSRQHDIAIQLSHSSVECNWRQQSNCKTHDSVSFFVQASG